MTVFRKIKPSSIESPYKEDYEFLLIWLSPNGGIRQWFFSSTEGERDDKFTNIVIDTIEDFRNIPNIQEITIEIFTRAVSREEFDFITSIFESNRVILADKDSNITPIAILKSRKRTARIIKDFEVSFDIMFQEPDLMNV